MSKFAASVFIPIVNNDGSAQRFLQVQGEPAPAQKMVEGNLDTAIAALQDYGYYPAGKTAVTAYRQLLNHWRKQANLPTWVTAVPKGVGLRVLSKLSDTLAYEGSSSELGLLLAMLLQQKRLPYARIYATGSLAIAEDKLPAVTPIDGLSAKTNAIIRHLESTPPAKGQRALVAFPKRAYEQPFDEQKNNTEKLVGRRLAAFLQAQSHLQVDVLYFDDLQQDLCRLYPSISRYRRLRPWVWTLPLWLATGLFAWQYQQPLSIRWEAQAVYPLVSEKLADTPQRATVNNAGQMTILPPCPATDVGNIILQQDDILLMTISIEDNSWFRGQWLSPPFVVLVGAKSDIRVEPMNYRLQSSQELGKPVYNLAFTLEPPLEPYAVIAVSKRGIATDKGKLNQTLNALTQGVDGISKITTVTGYLQTHYATADFRFFVKSPQQCHLKSSTEPSANLTTQA